MNGTNVREMALRGLQIQTRTASVQWWASPFSSPAGHVFTILHGGGAKECTNFNLTCYKYTKLLLMFLPVVFKNTDYGAKVPRIKFWVCNSLSVGF